MSDSDVFIASFHGGLGDSLQFSTLPEEFYKQKGRKTYVWGGATFRNQEIYDLVWGANPYVHGVKDGEWNAGDLPTIEYSNVAGTCISNWEQLHGLEPKNKFPKIYYEPFKVSGFRNNFLVDLSSISIDYDHKSLYDKFNSIKQSYPDNKFTGVTFAKSLNSSKFNQYGVDVDEIIEISSIFEYCDLIASSFGMVALSSGASHLSSAIKKYAPHLNSICIMDSAWYNHHVNRGNLFLFDNIDYQVI
jgi:hypothetical protein|tara:strand:- start:6037 stop:6774 length:738 start_codon:yes stop_codon:yes gene_type:complete